MACHGDASAPPSHSPALGFVKGVLAVALLRLAVKSLDGKTFWTLFALVFSVAVARWPDRLVGTSPHPSGTVRFFRQWPILGDTFDLFCLVVAHQDRSLLTVLHEIQMKELPPKERLKQKWPRSLTFPGMSALSIGTRSFRF